MHPNKSFSYSKSILLLLSLLYVLYIQFMFEHMEGISTVMIVDLDAHQGNGHERDFLGDDRVYIMDMYNRWIYPNDRYAKGNYNYCVRGN